MEEMSVVETGIREQYVKLSSTARLRCIKAPGAARAWSFERQTQRGEWRATQLSDLGSPDEVEELARRSGLDSEPVADVLTALVSMGANPQSYGVSRAELDNLRSNDEKLRDLVMLLPRGRLIGKVKVELTDGQIMALAGILHVSPLTRALVRDLTRNTTGRTVSAWVSHETYDALSSTAAALRITIGEYIARKLEGKL